MQTQRRTPSFVCGPPNGKRAPPTLQLRLIIRRPLRMLTVGRHFFARALDGVFPSLHRLSPTFPCSAETMAASGAARAPPEMRERFRGSLLGLAVGDAVGATVDGMKRGSFTAITDMVGGGNYRLLPGQVRTCSGATPLSDRSNPSTLSLYNLYLACIHFTLHCSLHVYTCAHFLLPCLVLQWADGTSMALCLAESLIEKGAFDPMDQGHRYYKWYSVIPPPPSLSLARLFTVSVCPS